MYIKIAVPAKQPAAANNNGQNPKPVDTAPNKPAASAPGIQY